MSPKTSHILNCFKYFTQAFSIISDREVMMTVKYLKKKNLLKY